MNDFPNMRRDYLLRALEDNGFHYLPTHRMITEGEGPSGAKKRKWTARKGLQGRKKRKGQVFGPQYLHTGDRVEPEPFPAEIEEIFFRELQFIRYEADIRGHLERVEREREERLERGRGEGSLEECGCCMDEECLAEDMVLCGAEEKEKHRYCRTCVTRHAETQVGDGHHRIKCLSDECESEVPLKALQDLLRPSVVDLILRRSQEHEIQNAQLENMESCPFCNFAMIMENREDRVFRCQNPECLKESCRECQEVSHIPLRCEEVEKADETRMRTFVENKMAEAMIRKCLTCNKRIVKSDGCNKMKCPCGTAMCYVCGEQLDPMNPYSHFERGGGFFGLIPPDNNDGGGEKKKKGCPLHTSINQVNADVAEKAGVSAKDAYIKDHPEMDQKKLNVEDLVDRAPPDPRERFLAHHRHHLAAGAAGIVNIGIVADAYQRPERTAEQLERIERQRAAVVADMARQFKRRAQEQVQQGLNMLEQNNNHLGDERTAQFRLQFVEFLERLQNFGVEENVGQEGMVQMRRLLHDIQYALVQAEREARQSRQKDARLKDYRRKQETMFARLRSLLAQSHEQLTPEVAQGFHDRLEQLRDGIATGADPTFHGALDLAESHLTALQGLQHDITRAAASDREILAREFQLNETQHFVQKEMERLKLMKQEAAERVRAPHDEAPHASKAKHVTSQSTVSSWLSVSTTDSAVEKRRLERLLEEIQRHLTDENEAEFLFEMIRLRDTLDQWGQLNEKERHQCSEATQMMLQRARTGREAQNMANTIWHQVQPGGTEQFRQQFLAAAAHVKTENVSENLTVQNADSERPAPDADTNQLPAPSQQQEKLVKVERDVPTVDNLGVKIADEELANASLRDKRKVKNHESRIQQLQKTNLLLKSQVEMGRPYQKRLTRNEQALESERSRLANLIADIREENHPVENFQVNNKNSSESVEFHVSGQNAPNQEQSMDEAADHSPQNDGERESSGAGRNNIHMIQTVENLREESQRLQDTVSDAQRALAKSSESGDRRSKFQRLRELMKQRDAGLRALHEAEENALKNGVSEIDLRGEGLPLNLNHEDISAAAAEAQEAAARKQEAVNKELAKVQRTGSPKHHLTVLDQLIQELGYAINQFRQTHQEIQFWGQQYNPNHDYSPCRLTALFGVWNDLLEFIRIIRSHGQSPDRARALILYQFHAADARVQRLLQISNQPAVLVEAVHALRTELEADINENLALLRNNSQSVPEKAAKKLVADSRFLTRRISREKERVKDNDEQPERTLAEKQKLLVTRSALMVEIENIQEQITEAQEQFRTAVKDADAHKTKCQALDKEIQVLFEQENSLRKQIHAVVQKRDQVHHMRENLQTGSTQRVEKARQHRDALEARWNALQSNLSKLHSEINICSAGTLSSPSSASSVPKPAHNQQPDDAQETSTVELVERPTKRDAAVEDEDDLMTLVKALKDQGHGNALKDHLKSFASKKDAPCSAHSTANNDAPLKDEAAEVKKKTIVLVDLESEDETEKPEVIFDNRPGVSEEKPIVIEEEVQDVPEVSTVEIVAVSPAPDLEPEGDGEDTRKKEPCSLFRCTQCGFHTTTERIYILHCSMHDSRKERLQLQASSEAADVPLDCSKREGGIKREKSVPVVSAHSIEKKSRSASIDDVLNQRTPAGIGVRKTEPRIPSPAISPIRTIIDQVIAGGAAGIQVPVSQQGFLPGENRHVNQAQNPPPGMIQINIHFPGDPQGIISKLRQILKHHLSKFSSKKEHLTSVLSPTHRCLSSEDLEDSGVLSYQGQGGHLLTVGGRPRRSVSTKSVRAAVAGSGNTTGAGGAASKFFSRFPYGGPSAIRNSMATTGCCGVKKQKLHHNCRVVNGHLSTSTNCINNLHHTPHHHSAGGGGGGKGTMNGDARSHSTSVLTTNGDSAMEQDDEGRGEEDLDYSDQGLHTN